MMIAFKKTIAFFMVIFLMIGVYGCDMRGQYKIDGMLSYVNNKYSSDNFEYVGISGGYLGSNTMKIIVKSEKYPDKVIRVLRNEVEGKIIYSDTYLNVKFEEETYEYIKNTLISEYGDNIYLKYIPDDTACTENGSDSTTFDEYISAPSTYVYFSALVPSNVNSKEATIERVKELFSGAVIRAHIFYVNSEYYSEETAPKIIENEEYSHSLFFIKKSIDEYTKVEWNDGV